MKRKLQFKSLLLLAVMLICGANSALATVVTKTYVFTSATWTATLNDNAANWTSGKDGAGYNNNGIQVTKNENYNGANATSPVSYTNVSKIVVTYNTNKSAGEGTIGIKIGSNDAVSKEAKFTGNADGRSANFQAEYNYEVAQSGNVTITVKTTTNSLYICSIAITYDDPTISNLTETAVTITSKPETATVGEEVEAPQAVVKAGSETVTSPAIKWSSSETSVATIDQSTGAITPKAAGTTIITATYDGNETYKSSFANFELTVNAAALKTYTSIAELQSAATATETPIKFTFNNILVTAAKGKNAYITDGTYGALVYTDGHELKAGDIINGTIETTLVLYKGQTEITGVKASDENLTITSGTVTPVEKALSEITVANQSLLVTLKGLTYNSSDKTFTDGTNKIAYYKNFTSSDPALENGKVYDVTGVVIVFNETLEISPLNTDDVVEVVSAEQEAPVSAWVSGSEEVSSICVLTNNSISVSYSTNSTGEKSFESSDTKVATVDADGNITLTGTPGVAKITAVTKENNDFFASTASLTILVAAAESEDAVFDFSLFQDYGSGMAPTSENVYVEEERTWTAGNITMKTGGKVRWYIGSSEGVTTYTLRLYGKTEPYSYMTLSAPEGYYISAIDGLAGSLKANTGKISSGTWSGMAQEVTFTYESTSKNAAMSSLKVTYTQPEFTMEIGSDYTAFSSKMALDFSESGIAVYTAKVNDGVVVLTEVESGEVPANRGVILKGTAGEHTVKLIESAEALKNNELFGVTEDTKVVYNEEESSKYNYILQNGVFKKATEAGATLKAGKAYLSTKYDVTATGARELKIVVEGETTGIKAIETAADKNVYDLLGRKVAAPTKGLYIVNGKKMIVK